MIFYTSDLHFGHANAIKFDERPFTDVDDMADGMIHNWNSRVGKNDTVYILGDFCFKLKDPEPKMDYVSDRGKLIVMCHFPIAEWNKKKSGAYHFYGHIHKSSPEVYSFMTGQGRAYNVGCMINNYMPCTADEIIRNNEIYQARLQSEAK